MKEVVLSSRLEAKDFRDPLRSVWREGRRAIPSKVNRESAVSGQVGEPLQVLDYR